VFAPFTTTAKEEVLSPFPLCCADPALASCMVNLKKPHQGVAGEKSALHPGITWSNSTSALGLRSLAVENRVRSRCTGKERDAESGNDYFGARYYASSMGRWMSPDWAAGAEAIPYADFSDPQSLNLYSYVRNNPLSKSDPDGHCDVDGEHHFGWCIFHTLGFYDTQVDRVNQARNFLTYNNVMINGNHVDPTKLTDAQALATFKAYNDAYLANGGGRNPNAALAGLLPGAGLKYEPNLKHGATARGDISAEPTNPEETLKNSVSIKETSTARVGVDPATGEYVMFRETGTGTNTYHGYAVKDYNSLPNEAKAALQNAGLVSQRGKIQ
jgi:RHS repeat-associated protein